MKKKKLAKGWKWIIQGAPLVAVVGATFLPIQRLGQQFLILIVLLWMQVFFISNIFLINK